MKLLQAWNGFWRITWHRILCVILLCALLLVGGVGVCLAHGEWFFAAWQSIRRYPEPNLLQTRLTGETEEWLLEDLKKANGVTLSTCLMLVNASHPLPDGYNPELVEYNGAKMHPLMLNAYISLRDTVEDKTGIRIYVSSDYRTAEEQAEILASSEEGVAAQLGCSEHEAGLALDVYAPYCAGMNFLKSRAGRAVNLICHDYGYIIRYPDGKEDVTGILYEPWHLRYVGQPHATVMMESGLTMEEYIELLTPEVWFAVDDYLILRTAESTVMLPQEWSACEMSPDNTGYYIITLKMN